ncbi:MAG: exosortase/archaeosortase family protein, partial [Cytophagales bacterium]|nr:exosortase/archaeosortase family protein [Armatimonadota bacterium]
PHPPVAARAWAWLRTDAPALIRHLWKTQRQWLALGLLAVAILYRPFTWFWEIWTIPDSPLSYQPLVPLGVAWLAWMERDEVTARYGELTYLFPTDSPKRRGKLWPVLTGCFLMLVAYLMTIPPLAMLSFLLMTVGVIYYLYGPHILHALRRPLGYLLVMAPVPNVVVSMATQKLQLGCAAVAGQILHLVHPEAKVVGTFIQLPNYAMEVVGPCSGVSILFPVAAMTIWLALQRRMQLFPALLLLCIGGALSLVMNVLRIVMMGMIGVAHPDLAKTIHDMNSIAFTALAFYLTFLCANLLARRWSLPLPALRRGGAAATPSDGGYYSDVYAGQFPTVADVAAQNSQTLRKNADTQTAPPVAEKGEPE